MADRMLNRREVEQRCGISASTIYAQMQAGDFPRPLRVGARAVRWPQSTIEAWLASRPRADGDRAA